MTLEISLDNAVFSVHNAVFPVHNEVVPVHNAVVPVHQLEPLLDLRGGLNLRRHLSDLVLHALEVSHLSAFNRRTNEGSKRCRSPP